MQRAELQRARLLRAGLLGVALLVVATGCSGVHQLSFPAPRATTPPPPVSAPVTLPDLTGVRQQPVSGESETSPPVPVGPGAATIKGTVFGLTGPAGGATVEADRFVGSDEGSTRVTTAANGTFSIPRVLGGRWRIRAWKAPNLDITTPQTFFLAATGTQTTTLSLNSFTTPAITGAMNPAPPVDSQPFNLVVQVERPAVTADGVVSYAPVPGVQVTLVGGAEWQPVSGNPAPTNGNGVATFQLTCSTMAVPSTLTAAVQGIGDQDLNVPGCVAAPTPPPPTTATTAPVTTTPVTSVPGSSSTSTPSKTTPRSTTTTVPRRRR